MRRVWKLLLSLGVSAGILGLMFREADRPAAEVGLALVNLSLWVWLAYGAGQLLQGALRAARYRLLLAGAGVRSLPSRGRMFGVTLARNMFVDMLPARAGELMYWALLNRGENIDHEDCASSMALSIWFDFLALIAVLGFALGVPVLDAQQRLWMVWGAGVVVGVVAVGAAALLYGPRIAIRMMSWLPARWQAWRWWRGLETFLRGVESSIASIRRARVLSRVVGLSVAIRVVKYAGMAIAFYGVARVMRPVLAELPLWQVLVGLISGEGGAALPIPTMLSMGTYEAAGAGALALTGVTIEDAGLVLLGAHVLSQLIDYALGGLGLLGLLWSDRSKDGNSSAPPSAAKTSRRWLRTGSVALVLVLACVVGGAWTWRSQKKSGSKKAPGAGEIHNLTREQRDQIRRVWGNRTGFVVWSSTMFGNHELVRMDLPAATLTRLTSHPHVDRSPRISPDGRRVVFARSREPWVSFRNHNDWDIWLLDLADGTERRVAEFGAEPDWAGGGQAVVFQRRAEEVVRVELDSGRETVLLGKRRGIQWTGPGVDPLDDSRLAMTLRGWKRQTAFVGVPDGVETKVAGGCQLAFVPSGEWLVLVESGGRMQNRICRVERDGSKLTTLLDMPLPWSHEYFPRVSNDGSLMVFGAAQEGHEHDTADYEIFVWRVGGSEQDVARLTFHAGNDHVPDVWVNPR